MKNLILESGNIFFLLFHGSLIVFNVFGWVIKRWRKIHLISMSLTAFSWFVLGIWYGWGYCLCTDWHWEIREKLGYEYGGNSYIHFLIRELTGLSLPEKLVDAGTATVFFTVFTVSITIYLRSRK